MSTGCTATFSACWTWATIRMGPASPVRPSGEVIWTASALAGRWSVDAARPVEPRTLSVATQTAARPRCTRMAAIDSALVDRRLFADEVAAAGGLEQIGRQDARLVEVFGQRQGMMNQVARMAAPKRDAARPIPRVDQALDKCGLVRNALVAATVCEDRQKFGRRRALREDLVLNSPQEG